MELAMSLATSAFGPAALLAAEAIARNRERRFAMKRFVSVCVLALIGMIAVEAQAQGRGGGGGRGNCAPRMPATGNIAAAAVLTDSAGSGSPASSAARLRQQANLLRMQQAYLL